ncbi:hypothetical protein PHLGIDRAFT_129299 [Phlebiopsis gigantea 11061_1 CR5-6]|uniref:Uncharacterized protein n=1 Tax=Phlebiopsis gigantea (strain 11061_1 CR5-6) TaxID=745531 RepID=A0A0C3S423_PHLG1|nr:hypothetical protein PHLGIDRAFT_129299 [Phlebiopsis gigantea 11061_1 CR5-6]
MPPVDSPLNAAHQHAANADDYTAQGLLIPASEEHYKAAEAFEAAYQASTEDNTKRTLRMLYNEHRKAGKELQRKIMKLREENKDPSLPQKPSKSSTSTPTNANKALPQTAPSPPPQTPRGHLMDSQPAVDESFMLLGQRSEPGDAFNHFWKITEGMLDYLSQPVAFASAPLSPPENGGASSDTDVEDPISKTLSRGLGFVKAAKSRMLTRHDSSATMSSDSDGSRAGISTFPPKPQPLEDWDDDLGDDDDMADSFCMVPSKADPPVSALKQENAVLKAQLEEERKRLAHAEKMLKQRKEQDNHLRESIMMARKEAHRAMASSMALRPPQPPAATPTSPIPVPPVLPAPPPMPVDIAGLKIAVSPLTPPANVANGARDQEAQHLRRIRELEEELRVVRVDNEKQRAMIVKFRERWDKLKESARKKKQAKATAESTSVVNDRIEEDPEAEAEAERDDLRPQKQTENLSASN